MSRAWETILGQGQQADPAQPWKILVLRVLSGVRSRESLDHPVVQAEGTHGFLGRSKPDDVPTVDRKL